MLTQHLSSPHCPLTKMLTLSNFVIKYFFTLPSLSATPELVSLPQDQAASEAEASASISVDSSQPVTSIQIRLADGGRLVQKFNHTHR